MLKHETVLARPTVSEELEFPPVEELIVCFFGRATPAKRKEILRWMTAEEALIKIRRLEGGKSESTIRHAGPLGRVLDEIMEKNHHDLLTFTLEDVDEAVTKRRNSPKRPNAKEGSMTPEMKRLLVALHELSMAVR